MIDESKMSTLQQPAAKEPKRVNDTLLDMTPKELRKLRTMIDELLPEQTVKDLNLEDELLQQYNKTKQLMDDCIEDSEVPPNQKAQVANSVVSTLGALVKLQEDLKIAQTMKLMEATFIEVIKTLPQEVKDAFFEEYEDKARKAGLM